MYVNLLLSVSFRIVYFWVTPYQSLSNVGVLIGCDYKYMTQ